MIPSSVQMDGDWPDGLLPGSCLAAPLTLREENAQAAGRALRTEFDATWPSLCYRSTRAISSLLLAMPGSFGSQVRRAAQQSRTSLKAHKVVFLWHLLRDRPVNVVYEFGAGGSTFWLAALMARQAAKSGRKPRLVSFEQDEDYFQRIKAAMPAELQPYVEIVLSPVSVWGSAGYRALSYDALPLTGAVDLAYIDGPAPLSAAVNGRSPPTFSGDFVRLVDAGVALGGAATDARLFNRPYFERALAGRATVRPAPMFHSLAIDIVGEESKV